MKRYYHKCPKCGKRRLCRGVYGRDDVHEIRCTSKCRGVHRTRYCDIHVHGGAR